MFVSYQGRPLLLGSFTHFSRCAEGNGTQLHGKLGPFPKNANRHTGGLSYHPLKVNESGFY